MKNQLYHLLFLLCFSNIYATAQVSIGIKGGISEAWNDYEFLRVNDLALSFQVGTEVYYALGNHVKIGIEPGYFKRITSTLPDETLGFILATISTHTHFIEFPFMFSGNLSLFHKKMELFAKLGYGLVYMAAANRLSESIYSEPPPSFYSINLQEIGYDGLNRWTSGLYAGFGLAYNFSRHSVFIESRYYRGLGSEVDRTALKSRRLNFNLGYTIDL